MKLNTKTRDKTPNKIKQEVTELVNRNTGRQEADKIRKNMIANYRARNENKRNNSEVQMS